ncbi:MAG: hypothetical protein ACYDCC_04750 [Actinomycetota bacterium]
MMKRRRSLAQLQESEVLAEAAKLIGRIIKRPKRHRHLIPAFVMLAKAVQVAVAKIERDGRESH